MSITREYLEERRQELLKSLDKLRQDAQATDGALQLCAFLIDKCSELDKPQLVKKDAVDPKN